jgi:CHAD domain-containing protein
MARPTPVQRLDASTKLDQAARELLHSRFADVERELVRSAHRFEPEAIHDLRVACRRLRAAIKLFGKKDLRRKDGHVERLQDALGELRDAQLTLAWLEGPDGALVARERAKVAAADAKLRKAMALWSLRSSEAVLRALPSVHRRGTLGGERLRRRLRKRLRKLRRAAREARTLEPRASHALRIVAKKLRYEAELLRAAFDVDALLDATKEVQDVFGDLHDADVRVALTSGDEEARRAARRERERRRVAARELLARFERDRVLPRLLDDL